MNEFGFTNNDADFAAVADFREAAIADGWSIEPLSQEPIESWAKIEKDGFVGHVLARRNVGKWKYQARVSLWGPDGIDIKPPRVYNWDEINKGLRHCPVCGADGVATERVGFANRSCAKCSPELRKQIETPGWNN